MHNAGSMFGFNWIDAIIVVLLTLAVIEGVRIGLLTQLFVIAGFFVTLFVAGWLFPYLLPIHHHTVRTIINASLVLLAATYAAVRSFDLGQRIHWSFRLGKLTDSPKLKTTETVLGSIPGIIAGLVLVWLLGVAIGRLPFEGFSNSVSDSRIVQQLTSSLPPVPAVFAEFDRHINPNSQPHVFAQPKPHAGFDYSVADVQTAESKAEPSLVRLTSFGCGGLVSGTGFAIGQHLIATNAHVIAGIRRTIIKYHGHSYEGVPVVFNPTLDLAILRVPKLTVLPLVLAQNNAPIGATVAVLGYPGGNYHVVPGILRDTLAVSARSIYDQGMFGRGIYEIQAHVEYGSSGSPVVLADGEVAGIIFSKSTDLPNQAYALTSPHLVTALRRARTSYRRVNDGACMVD